MWQTITGVVQLIILLTQSWIKFKTEKDEEKKKLQKELTDEAFHALKPGNHIERDRLLSKLRQ